MAKDVLNRDVSCEIRILQNEVVGQDLGYWRAPLNFWICVVMDDECNACCCERLRRACTVEKCIFVAGFAVNAGNSVGLEDCERVLQTQQKKERTFERILSP